MTNRTLVCKEPHVIICGGGVIGASIAYFLSLRKIATTLIERTGVANGASGKSGGFLALDWCQGTPVDALARRSFQLHAQLAETLGAQAELNWGYRRLNTLSVVASERRNHQATAREHTPAWLGSAAAVVAQLGDEQSCAQIDPALFTQSLMRAAAMGGVQLRSGVVEGVALADDGSRVTGVYVDGETLHADVVVIALGPWSMLACQWLPLPAVYGLKGHSLLFRFRPEDPAALFVELENDTGEIQTPEVVPRMDGTTYVSGLSGVAPLPVDPAQVAPDPGAPERLRAMTTAFAPALGACEVVATQACFRPVTADGLPLIGRVPNVDGAFVATGHSVWGMLNGPATGEAMAELIVDGAATHVDLAPFDPARLSNLPSV